MWLNNNSAHSKYTEIQCKMSSCFGCGKSLTSAGEKKRSGLLSNPSRRGVLDILISTASGLCTEVDCFKLHTGHICRLCLALLERYTKVQKQVTSNLRSAMSILPKKSACPMRNQLVPVALLLLHQDLREVHLIHQRRL